MEQGRRPAEGNEQDWHTYWESRGQPWRREPEISADRQGDLARMRAGAPPMNAASEEDRRVVPFAGVRLTRADMEWLLATHEDQGIVGPVIWGDEGHEKRLGPDVRGADMHGVDLSGLPLVKLVAGPDRVVMHSPDDIYVAEAEVLLEDADLRGALLDGASLKAAHLARANLVGASLRSALMINANLEEANLAHTTLDEANFQWSGLSGACLENAHGEGTCLRSVQCARVIARQVTLIRSDASGSLWTGADLTDATLDQSDFSYAVLPQTTLVRAHLKEAQLRGANLEDANLTGALLEHADLYETWMAGAIFDGANVYGADTLLIRWDRRPRPTGGSTPEKPDNVNHADKEVQNVPSRPSPDAAPPTWQEYWKAVGQPWRREPEISSERQAYLAGRRAMVADVRTGVYPLKDVEPKLSRADMEWLLATHENKGIVGPVSSPKQAFVNWMVLLNPTSTQTDRMGPDIRGADLRELDLSGLPLSTVRAGLYGSETTDIGLYGDDARAAEEAASVRLEGANLRDAVLDHAMLTRVHGDGCDMTGASLRQCTFESASLNGACLVEAYIEQSTFNLVSLRNANLGRAHASNTHFDSATLDGLRAEHADLSGAWFFGLTLRDVQLEGARLIGAHLSSSTFENGSLESAVLDDADLKGAQLEGARLEGASMRGADLRCYQQGKRLVPATLKYAHMRRVVLKGALMEDTDCTGADLSGADLSQTHLRGVHLDGAVLDLAAVVEADMAGTSLAGASLQGIDLRRTVLDPRTTLEGARFGAAQGAAPRVAGVHWNDADLSDIDWSTVRCLGDELEALRPITPDKKRKSTEQRLRDLEEAGRANRQLALALAAQGFEESNRFAYRAQILEQRLLLRRMAWQRTLRPLGPYLFSGLLGLLTGYGYRLTRLLIAYVLIISLAAVMYVFIGMHTGEPVSWADAYLISVTAFHGRVFFANFGPASPLSWIAAVEGVIGLVIEGVFVAMLTQRFFSK